MSLRKTKEYEDENRKLRKALGNMKKLVEELTDRDHMFQQIIEKLPAIIYINDANKMSNEWMNSHGAKFLGHSVSEIKKMGFNFFTHHLHADDMEMVKKSLDFYNTSNGEFSGVYRMKNKNNEYRWIYSNTCVLKRNPDGSPWMIIGVGFDITERIKTEPQLKILLRENLLLKNSNLVKQLTKREKELIKLIAKGYTNKKIAEELKISYLTAQTHRKNILKKLDAKNTAGITSFVLQNHID